MQYYLTSADEVLKKAGVTEDGLTSAEAAKRLEKNGKNKLAEAKKDGILKKFLKSLADPMILLLLAAAAISTVTSIAQNESFADLFVILFVVIVNTVLGMVQESKAEHAIDSLMEMTAATSKVIRDGKIVTVKSEELVTGDIIILEAGDSVPADCRIIESHSMKVEEAALTGESVPVNKIVDILMLKHSTGDIALGDRKNMLYSGSTVVYGRGRAVVVSVGMDTEMGKIAGALAQAKLEQTPLQKRMAELSGVLTKLVIGICVIVFVLGIIRNGTGSGSFGMLLLDTFILAVALAVAAIPEGLPAIVTIVLSIGVTSMSKRQALIRKLTAVETLGCTQVICSDKTGTLTQNKMTVVDRFTNDETLLVRAMALCSDALISPGEKNSEGEPTECALVNYANSKGFPKYELEKNSPRIGEAPFDSERKMMSTVHIDNGKIVQYTKGACEMLLNNCTGYLSHGQVVPMTDKIRETIIEKNREFAGRALRVLGAAYKKYKAVPLSYEPKALENDLIFIGFVGMIDPCRPEVYEAIKSCREAGIRPIMITGDHRDTAVAIGKDLKIISDASEAITGVDIENMSDGELFSAVEKYSVYARVQPEHKTRIVKAWKAHGMITAMTGDGVNDAPSIKAADIGIGMGITGTAVTKGVSDMVLADDNFATIVHAVEEGRRIFDNIRKVLQFQLSTNMAEVAAVFTASIMGFEILTPAHLLWVNMVTDSTPGLALGMEKAEGDLMKRKPRASDEGVFSNGAGVDMIYQGLFMAALIIASYFMGLYIEIGEINIAVTKETMTAHQNGMSMAFITANFVEMFHAFCMRSQRGSIFKMNSRNKWMFGALLITGLLVAGVIYIPFLSNLFNIAPISYAEFIIAFGFALAIIPIIEIVKFIQRAAAEKKSKN